MYVYYYNYYTYYIIYIIFSILIYTLYKNLIRYMNSVPKAKITKRKLAEPAFKKAPRITGLDFLNNYYKKLEEAHGPERSGIVLSRREDEGVSKDYRNKGIIAGNKYGRFSSKWMDPTTGQDYLSHWQARANTPEGTKIVRFPETRNQVSVLSSAIDSYDYYPDVKRLLLRYTSNPNKEYTFDNVTSRRKQDLDNAASKGRFVQYVLRKYNRAAGY